MNTTESLRAILRASGLSARKASIEMQKSENYISSVIGQAERMQADMNASTVASIAAACGYALALVPLDELPGGAVVIDAPERKQ